MGKPGCVFPIPGFKKSYGYMIDNSGYILYYCICVDTKEGYLFFNSTKSCNWILK